MEPLLRLDHISKHFGGVTALQDISMELRHDEVLALLGDNGAGKSTLVKTVAGVYQPDSGQIFLDGELLHLRTPTDARLHRIETIYQDLALIDQLDLAANIFLGREPVRRWLGGLITALDRPKMMAESSRLLQDLGVNIPSVRARVRSLSGGQRQAVAISRAVYWDARIVIMDEPTAALGVRERRHVLDLILHLKSRGVSVILVSHNMPDVLAVADRIVVLRRGHKVGERLVAECSESDIVSMIVGTDPRAGGATAGTAGAYGQVAPMASD